MDCKIKVVKRDGKELTYENAVLNKEKGVFNIYQLDDVSTCMRPMAKFDPCKLKSIYIG